MKRIIILSIAAIIAIGALTYYLLNKDITNNKTQGEVTQAVESSNTEQNTKVETVAATATTQLSTAQETVVVATPAQKPAEKTPATESTAPSTSITKKASPSSTTTEGTKSVTATKPSIKSKTSTSSTKKVDPAPTEPKADANGYIYTKEQAIKNAATEWKKLKDSGDFNYTGALEEAKNNPDFSQESFDADFKQMTTNPYSSEILAPYFDDYRGGGDLGTLIGKCVGWLAVGGDDGTYAEYGAE